MKTTSFRARSLSYARRNGISKGALLALLSTTAYCGMSAQPAYAQVPGPNATPADHYAVSGGGVDMRTGQYRFTHADLTLGGEAGLSLVRDNGDPESITGKPFGDFAHNWNIYITRKSDGTGGFHNGRYYQIVYQIAVHAGGRSQNFSNDAELTSSIDLTSLGGDYGQLHSSGTGSSIVFTHTAADGTVTVFHPIDSNDCVGGLGNCAFAGSMTQPDGQRYDFAYDAAPSGRSRLRRVTSNRGFAILFEYAAPQGDKLISKACIINLATMTAPSSNICPSGARAATYTYQSNGQLASYTDSTGATWTYSNGYDPASGQTGDRFFRPGESSPYLVNVGGIPITHQSFADGRTFDYTWTSYQFNDASDQIAGGGWTRNGGASASIAYQPLYKDGANGAVQLAISSGPAAITDELGRTASGDYCVQTAYGCASGPVQSWTFPEGNKVTFSYDGYRNVTQRREIAKPGTGLLDIVTSATYACASAATCSKPNTKTDANGNVTTYTYDLTHGGVLTETGPAVSGVQPQKRYTYAQRYAWISDGAGGYTTASSPVWVLTQESFCKTGAAAASGTGCANGASDEVVTTYDYGPNAGPNNLQLRGKVVDAGGLSLRTCYAYDSNGERLSTTSPRAGLTSCP